jgi:hypothetical protein
MGKYSREFDGDGSRFKLGSKVILPGDKKAARWISGSTLFCWLLLSVAVAVFERGLLNVRWLAESLETIVAMPMLALTHSLHGQPDWESSWMFAILFYCLGLFAWLRSSKWAAILLMGYFIVSVLLGVFLLQAVHAFNYHDVRP